jgi:hypothetical protein
MIDAQQMPPLSTTRALDFPHRDWEVLLGVGLAGQTVTHPVRVGDGGSPSLLLVGEHGYEVLATIWLSWLAWCPGATFSMGRAPGLDPDPNTFVARVKWADGTLLTVTWKRTQALLIRGVRCRAEEQRKGVWWYWRRNATRAVPFYACRDFPTT